MILKTSYKGTIVRFNRMIVLPPELVVLIPAVFKTGFMKYFEHPFSATLLCICFNGRNDLLACKLLKVTKDITQVFVGCGDDQV